MESMEIKKVLFSMEAQPDPDKVASKVESNVDEYINHRVHSNDPLHLQCPDVEIGLLSQKDQQSRLDTRSTVASVTTVKSVKFELSTLGSVKEDNGYITKEICLVPIGTVPLGAAIPDHHNDTGTKKIALEQPTRSPSLEASLDCEWSDCHFKVKEEVSSLTTSEALKEFLRHVAAHAMSAANSAPASTTAAASVCLWRGCGYSCNKDESQRHVNFHGYHTNLKLEGLKNIFARKRQKGSSENISSDFDPDQEQCGLGSEQRNVIPELLEPLVCRWKGCQPLLESFQEPIKFYWHVAAHGACPASPEDEDCAPAVKGAAGARSGQQQKKYRCLWGDCKAEVSKLKEHLRAHSQEKKAACPTCGALFASFTKLHDHCHRHLTTNAADGFRGSASNNSANQLSSRFRCSYCQKCFGLERLLRDHIRSHINSFKCPLCDMTCSTAGNVATHMAHRHFGDVRRPFACPHRDTCGKDFVTRGDLLNHVARVHEGLLKVSCTICDFQACNKSVLKTHMRLKHLSTEKVDTTNKGAADLLAIYCCDLCTKRYREGTSLTRHLRKVHNFQLPSGHSRLRFKFSDDGLYHVQNIRFETADLVVPEFAFLSSDEDDDREAEGNDQDRNDHLGENCPDEVEPSTVVPSQKKQAIMGTRKKSTDDPESSGVPISSDSSAGTSKKKRPFKRKRK